MARVRMSRNLGPGLSSRERGCGFRRLFYLDSSTVDRRFYGRKTEQRIIPDRTQGAQRLACTPRPREASTRRTRRAGRCSERAESMSPRVAMWKRDVEGPGQARHAYSRAVAARIMETWALTTGLRAKGEISASKACIWPTGTAHSRLNGTCEQSSGTRP
jgi:hypothetical protein